jgi:hypothetical protein
MHRAYTVTGMVTDQRTVALDEDLPFSAEKVRVTLEPILYPKRPGIKETIEGIHRRQQDRGHIPASKEEVDAHIRRERDAWNS